MSRNCHRSRDRNRRYYCSVDCSVVDVVADGCNDRCFEHVEIAWNSFEKHVECVACAVAAAAVVVAAAAAVENDGLAGSFVVVDGGTIVGYDGS